MSEDVSGEVRSVVRDVLDKGPEDLSECWTACADAGLVFDHAVTAEFA